MICRLALCLAVVALGVGLQAQSVGSVSADDSAGRVTDRIGALQAESDKLTSDARARLADLRILETERHRQIELVREAQDATTKGQASIESAAQRLLVLEAQRAAELPGMASQLTDMYKRGRTGYARLILSAGGIREFGRSMRAAVALLRLSQERVAHYRATIDALGEERVALQSETDAQRAREADALRARAAAVRAIANQVALLAKIDAQRDANARLAGELQIEQAGVTQPETTRVTGASTPAVTATLAPAGIAARAPAVAPAPAAARAPAATSGPGVATVTRAPRPTPAPATDTNRPPTPPAALTRALLWPVSGRVTGRFGRRLSAQEDALAANGIEIASREGNPVRAIEAGTVSFAGRSAGLGNLVIVDHGGNTLSLYGYLGSIAVNRDTVVNSGAELGRVGSGPSGGAALFLEIRIDGRSVDPVQWLRPL